MVTRMNDCPDERYDLDAAVPVLKLLAGKMRIEILAVLAEHSVDVHTVADLLHLDIKAVSHQLQALKHRHFVSDTHDLNRHIYSLNGVVKVESTSDALQLTIHEAGCDITIRIPSRRRAKLA